MRPCTAGGILVDYVRVPGVAVFTSLGEVREAASGCAEAVHALHRVPVGVAHDEAPDLVGDHTGRAVVGPPAAKGRVGQTGDELVEVLRVLAAVGVVAVFGQEGAVEVGCTVLTDCRDDE